MRWKDPFRMWEHHPWPGVLDCCTKWKKNDLSIRIHLWILPDWGFCCHASSAMVDCTLKPWAKRTFLPSLACFFALCLPYVWQQWEKELMCQQIEKELSFQGSFIGSEQPRHPPVWNTSAKVEAMSQSLECSPWALMRWTQPCSSNMDWHGDSFAS